VVGELTIRTGFTNSPDKLVFIGLQLLTMTRAQLAHCYLGKASFSGLTSGVRTQAFYLVPCFVIKIGDDAICEIIIDVAAVLISKGRLPFQPWTWRPTGDFKRWMGDLPRI
jgi:hypothetical protein